MTHLLDLAYVPDHCCNHGLESLHKALAEQVDDDLIWRPHDNPWLTDLCEAGTLAGQERLVAAQDALLAALGIQPGPPILAHGTASPWRDAWTQATTPPFGVGKPPGDWDWVGGELVTFDDPEADLPPIDHLEGFRWQGGLSLYDRVLVTVWVGGWGLEPVTAWTYDGRHISGHVGRCTVWPAA